VVTPAVFYDDFSVPQPVLLTNKIAREVMRCFDRDAINHFSIDPDVVLQARAWGSMFLYGRIVSEF
jgi:hypothetical protein